MIPMMTEDFKCPHCDEKMIRVLETELVMPNRIMVFRPNETVILCKHCGKEVRVPVKLVA